MMVWYVEFGVCTVVLVGYIQGWLSQYQNHCKIYTIFPFPF